MADESGQLRDGWHLLCRAHDHIWKNRDIPLEIRLDACDLLDDLMAKVARPKLPDPSTESGATRAWLLGQ